MGACDCDCYENLMGRLGEKEYYMTENTNLRGIETNTLIKNFDCTLCIKENVCKYKEIETPEIISKVKTRIDNEYCPPIINFTVSCDEFDHQYLTTK